jgi:hypothetical protein
MLVFRSFLSFSASALVTLPAAALERSIPYNKG